MKSEGDEGQNLEQREAALKVKEADFKERDAALKEQKKAFEERMASLKEREAAVKEREAAVKEREAKALQEREAALKGKEVLGSQQAEPESKEGFISKNPLTSAFIGVFMVSVALSGPIGLGIIAAGCLAYGAKTMYDASKKQQSQYDSQSHIPTTQGRIVSENGQEQGKEQAKEQGKEQGKEPVQVAGRSQAPEADPKRTGEQWDQEFAKQEKVSSTEKVQAKITSFMKKTEVSSAKTSAPAVTPSEVRSISSARGSSSASGVVSR